jgi:hypothetical protein
MKIRSIFLAVALSAALVLPSLPASACCGVLGADGYTRLVWNGTDGSISIWKTDGLLHVLATQNYGPYLGWTHISSAIIGDNYYLLWRNADGAADIWLLNSNLEKVATASYTPPLGQLPEGLGVDGLGNLRLFWRTSEDQVVVLLINQALDVAGSYPLGGPYFGWVF